MQEALKILKQKLEAEASARGLELIELTQKGQTMAPILDVRFDSLTQPGQITLNEIAEANEWVSEILEQEDLFPGSYTLEVSSPGLDMLLSKPEHFKRALNKNVKITTTGEVYADKDHPRKHYKGLLTSANPIMIEDSGQVFTLPEDHIVEARIVPTFDA